MPILTQNVCFDCRKVFKKPDLPYIDELKVKDRKYYKCPECGNVMQYMGIHFRAPAKDNIKEWDRIYMCIVRGIDWASSAKRKNTIICKAKK